VKVIFHNDFYQVYTHDPAAESGRLESIIKEISSIVTLIDAKPATETDIAAVHTPKHINYIKKQGLYDISALASGAAIQAATIALTEPSFALIRPPGHHASANSSWGFCFFNHMAIAIEKLKSQNKIKTAFILDFDLHYGDGNINILNSKEYVTILNPESHDRKNYLSDIQTTLSNCNADIIGVSAGFDNHIEDWGGLLTTQDYYLIGKMVRETANKNNSGCFGLLEGGYNHKVLGLNVKAFIMGLMLMDY